MEEPLDRFGQPLPPDPGYKEIWNADGTKPRSWEKLVLGADLTITSDEANKASVLNVSLPNPGAPIQVVASVTVTLRQYGNIPTDGTLFQTREYGVYGTGLGAWSYRWDSASTATDDGVLVIKADFLTTGRFLAVMPPDGIMNALACGPAAADLGTRTKSFDPAGVVEVGAECYRITRILREAGWAGLEVPNAGPYYLCTGTHIQVAPSSTPGVPFYFGSKSGARLQGLVGDHVAVVGLGFMARGEGDSATVQSLIAPDYDATCLPFTQTILGTEKTFGPLTTTTLAVGETVIVYLGADITDVSGIQAQFLISEIESISASPTGTVTLREGVRFMMPATPGTGGRTSQTYHTMRKMIGFQDGTVISGFRLNNVSVGGVFGRDCTVDCFWETAIFQHNHWGMQGLKIPTWISDKITGYNIGSGALSWYGVGMTLQQCYSTDIGIIKCANLDGVPLVSEEITCRGTHIGVIDCNWNAANAWNSTCAIIGGTGGQTDLIGVDQMLLCGGYGFASIIAATHVTVFEDRGSLEYEGISVSPRQFERMLWRGQGYNGKKRDQVIIPIADGTTFFPLPTSGVIRDVSVRVSTPGSFATFADIGVTQIGIDDGTNSGFEFPFVSGYVTSKDQWYPLYGATTLFLNQPNGHGQCTPTAHIVATGVPAGTFLHVDIEMFLPDLATQGQPVTTQSAMALQRGSAGTPTFNADYVGQDVFDSTNKIWRKSISKGNGALDWSRTYVPVQGTNLTDADQTLTPGGTVGEYLLPDSVLTTGRTKTISTSGATAGDRLVITSYETASHTMAVVNGGAGAGTLYTFAGTIPKQLSIVFDGTNWGSATVIPIT